MSKNDKPAPPPSSTPLEKGYQPKLLTEGYKPSPQGGASAYYESGCSS